MLRLFLQNVAMLIASPSLLVPPVKGGKTHFPLPRWERVRLKIPPATGERVTQVKHEKQCCRSEMAKPFGQKEKQLGKGEAKMNKIKSGMIFLMAVAFFTVLVVRAQSDKEVQPKKVKEKAVPVQLKDKVEPKQIIPAVSEPKIIPVSIPERAPLAGSRQGYQMVTDILDGFGGESESDNYRIPVNSGAQPSAIGLSESDNYGVQAGYVYASFVNRGEVTGDGLIDLGDLLFLISYLYKGGLAPCPVEVGDVNCDGIIDLGDILYLISYLYKGGPPPAC